MKKTTKIFLLLLSLLVIGGSVFLFTKLLDGSPAPTIPNDTKKEKDSEKDTTTTFKFGKLYVSDEVDSLFSLSVSSATEDTIAGVMHVMYVEDLYKEVSFIEHKWKVSGVKREGNDWNLRVSLDTYTDISLTATLDDDNLSLSEIPNLETQEVVLTNQSTYDSDKKKQSLLALTKEKGNRTKTNMFLNLPLLELETTLDDTLYAYPVNSNGTLSAKGQTRISIHRDYLHAITTHIESNFTKTENLLTDIEQHLKKSSKSNNPYFKEEGDVLFAQVNEVTSETEQFSELYNKIVSYYSYPDSDKENYFESDDETEAAIQELLVTYSFQKRSHYDKTLNTLKNQIDNHYHTFQKRSK